jgi:hypothetical protein
MLLFDGTKLIQIQSKIERFLGPKSLITKKLQIRPGSDNLGQIHSSSIVTRILQKENDIIVKKIHRFIYKKCNQI